MSNLEKWLDKKLIGCKEISEIYSKLKKDVENLKGHEQNLNLKRYEHYVEIFRIVKTKFKSKKGSWFDKQITECEAICKEFFEQRDTSNYERFGYYVEAYSIIKSHVNSKK